jgi:hypothetical protein
VLTMPRALGPITRMPLPRARRTSARWASTPSGPLSANPLLTTSSPGPGHGAVVDDGETSVGRHRHDGEGSGRRGSR